MDEILSYPGDMTASAPEVETPSQPWRRWHLPRFKWTGLQTSDFMAHQSIPSAVAFVIAGLSITAAAVLGGLYVPSYELSVDGESLGRLGSVAAIEEAVDHVEARASHILGYDYELKGDMACSYGLALEDDLTSGVQVENDLFNRVDEVMKSSVLTVNGRMMGAFESDAQMNAMLDELKAPYINENTVSAEFVEPVSVSRQYTPASAILEEEDMVAALTANSMEEVDYVVQSGDTFSAIANDHDMRMAQLEALNPQVEIDKLMVGDVLTISQAVPVLSVRTVDQVTYEAPVPFEVEEIKDDSMYQGDSRVITAGVEGVASYTADVTCLNGTEESRQVIDVNVLTQPVTKVVAVGTKERPRTMATGQFQWPLWGPITSGYGARHIFGSYSFHTGLDISAPYGTSIVAADGGRVTWAGTGTGSYWSYGNYVVIDHENGIQTIYAHCSGLNVSAGERVYKGQTIARVGSTGRATGNHLHFQVKQNGVTVNPYGYLP